MGVHPLLRKAKKGFEYLTEEKERRETKCHGKKIS